ncbi:MAG: tetratricopeptide repeat protein, partial [Phycisphaerales bacterium]|nr:tetratricopeptide repeat protein [Phycisphaerales bacterium]
FTSSIVAVFFILSIGLVYSLYMLGRVRAAELREREWREAAQGALTQARQGEAWREATRRTNMEHIRVIQTLPTDEAGLNSAKRAFRMIKESGLDDAGLLMWAAEVLGRKMYDAKRVPEAADFWEKAVGIARTSVAPTDPIRITLLNNLVQCLSETNQHDRAIPLTIELIDVKRTVGRDCDQVFATNLNNLGRMLFWRRRAAEAEPYLREALELHRLLRPPPHVEVTNATWKYAAVLCELGRLQEGEELLRSMMDQVGETGVDRSRYWGTVQKMIEAALYSPVGDAELLPSATIAFWVEAFARSGETPIEP